MNENRGTQRHYDTDFKLRVIAEIETGNISVSGARKKFNIPGKMTIQRWLKRFGKEYLLRESSKRVDYLSMSKNADRMSQLKHSNHMMEAALAQAQVRILALESLIEVADEHFKTNLKKNFGSRALKRQKRKTRRVMPL